MKFVPLHKLLIGEKRNEKEIVYLHSIYMLIARGCGNEKAKIEIN